jgi:2-aminoadipate transaminase
VAGIDLFLEEVAAAPVADIQFAPTADRLDLTWGHPDPTLLPVDELAVAAEHVLTDRPWRWLSYGAAAGAGRLRTALASHLGTTPDRLALTYGSTGALDLVLGVLGEPGDVVLVEQPTYFLVFGIVADRGLRTVGLPPGVDAAGALADRVGALRAEGRRGRTFLYVVPTHANPTGATVPEADRRALVEAAAAHDVTVVEDDVYSELGTEEVTPLWRLDPERVIRLGSFSKTLAPGLRLGFVQAAPERVAALAASGFLHSGGGASPLVAAIVADLLETGAYAGVVARLGTTYRERMAALLGAVPDAHLPAGRPTGGYFAWVAGDDGLVERAAAEGVAVAPAAAFHVDPVAPAAARVSCSLLGPDDLAEASVRLARALTDPGSGG